MMRRGKTGGKPGKKKPAPKKSEKPMSHGDKHKAMMDRITGDPEV
jgi:hypothetical protein